MNIALIGSGGREHALCQKIFESPLTNKVYCIPGNAGTSKIAQNIWGDEMYYFLQAKNDEFIKKAISNN